MPDDEQIGETAAHRQTLRVLRQPAMAHLGKAEHTLDYQKRMLDFGAHLGLRAVLAALHFIYDAAMAVAPVGEVLGVRRVIADHVFLPPIGLIAIHPRLVAVQQPAKQLCVMSRLLRWSPSSGSAWSCCPPRCAASSRNTTADPSASGASPGPVPWLHSWSNSVPR